MCIFAYGQTGSGKTHTMEGSDVSVASGRGINYRALDDLFDLGQQRAGKVTAEPALSTYTCNDGQFPLTLIEKLAHMPLYEPSCFHNLYHLPGRLWRYGNIWGDLASCS